MEGGIDRKQRTAPKLRDLLRKHRRESEGQLDSSPDVDFIYYDSDSQCAEIAELYSYTEESEFKFNREAFETTLFSQGHDKWTTMEENDRRKFVFFVIEKCEGVDPDTRLNAARILLYLVQGNFGEISDEQEQREWSQLNVFFLYKMGIMSLLIQLLNFEIENSHAALSALHKPAVSMADSVTLRVYLNIIYTVVEVIRYADPDESEEIAQVRESFFTELSQPCGNDELLPIVLLEMVLKFCAGSCPHFPIKKILLLLWKTILAIYHGRDVVAVLSTGYGKSVIFHLLPSLFLDKIIYERGAAAHPVVIVVSLLNALIKDQIRRLQEGNVKAAILNVKKKTNSEDLELDLSDANLSQLRDAKYEVSLGGIEELAKRKEEVRVAAGLPASYELQCPPQQPVINERTPAPHTPPPGSDSDSNGEIVWDRSEEEQEILRPPKLRPKVRQKDVDIFLDNTRNKFVGFQLRGDSQTIAGLPGPIHEGLSILKKHMYVSLSELQIKEEEEAANRPFTKGKVNLPSNAVEHLYGAMLPNLPQYMIALLKILLAAAPTAKAKTESINILADVLPEDMPSTVLHSMRLGIDVNRHKEIIVKAISGVLFLLLKHFKLNHIYQFEFMSQHLVFANCIPLILKFLNQNISAFIAAKNTIPQLDFPTCILGDPLELTAESLENADQEACCWRNLYSCINLLRILQKLTKWKHSRTMMLVVFKSAPILKRALKVKHEVLQLYVLKLLKAQTKYLGRNWRKSNMKTMSAIYQKVRHRLNDDWAYGNDLDARPWDFQAEECALRACVDRFNGRRYGIENGDRLGENGEEDEYLPVDNDIMSVLGEKVELSNEFKNNYERWLDREVFSVSIDWDQLCTCEMTTVD